MLKRLTVAIVIYLFAFRSVGFTGESEYLSTDEKKLGYALGLDVGMSIKRMAPTVDVQALMLGVKDGFTGEKPRMGGQEVNKLKRGYAKKQHEKKEQKLKNMASQNLTAGVAFLESNKQNDNVTETKSGLQYQILRKGSGDGVKEIDYVTVRMKGQLIDGTVFVDTFEEQELSQVDLSSLVPGLVEGIQLMKQGALYKFFLPARLGYGFKGFGKNVEPNSTLIYEIELIAVKKMRESAGQKKSTGTIDLSKLAESASPPKVESTKAEVVTVKEESTERPGAVKVENYLVSFDTANQAAASFYTLYNNAIMPAAIDEDIAVICGAVSTDNFYPTCKTICNERLTDIQSMKVKRAQFYGAAHELDESKNIVTVTWHERFELANDEVVDRKRSMEIFAVQDGEKWKVDYVKVE